MRTPGEVREALERLLDRRVELVRQEPYAYGTSFAIDSLEVRTPDGSAIRLLLKDLGAASAVTRSVRPGFLNDPLREIDVYGEILAATGLGTARCYGSVVEPRRGRYWLFLEHVPGVELWQVGELAIWEESARWLARLHRSCSDVAHPRLLQCDQRFYQRWLERSLSVTRDPRLQAIAAGFPSVVEHLLALPRTLIHNEFYPSNVLIARRGESIRVCPVDWEMAARGPSLIDLAALTGGKWSDADRAKIIAAYMEAVENPMAEGLPLALACCRLVLALRWLGWSRSWQPPREHAQDWLAVAVEAAAEVGIS